MLDQIEERKILFNTSIKSWGQSSSRILCLVSTMLVRHPDNLRQLEERAKIGLEINGGVRGL